MHITNIRQLVNWLRQYTHMDEQVTPDEVLPVEEAPKGSVENPFTTEEAVELLGADEVAHIIENALRVTREEAVGEDKAACTECDGTGLDPITKGICPACDGTPA